MAAASDSNSQNNNDDLIKASDFETVELSFTVKNTTTRTEVKNTDVVKLVVLGERGMSLELPSRSCAKGHNLIVSIKTRHAPKDFEFTFTAKVEEVASVDKTSDQIDVTMLQFDESQWNDLQSLFSNRQAEILEFLKAVKG
jgi:hypothetical protein